MSKYINADDVYYGMRKHEFEAKYITRGEFVDSLPSADVVEVKHGHWIENDNDTYSCSLCQSWIPNEQYYYARYCLHCGADMRERKETE